MEQNIDMGCLAGHNSAYFAIYACSFKALLKVQLVVKYFWPKPQSTNSPALIIQTPQLGKHNT